MAKETLRELDPEQLILKIGKSSTLYCIEATQQLKVFCSTISGPPESLGKPITFPNHQKVTIPDTCILLRLDIGNRFVAENLESPNSFIFLELIEKGKNKWKCKEIFPEKGKVRHLSVTTPVYKND